jgi:hypothetical protein
MKSKKMITQYQAIIYWAEKLEQATTCWRAEQVGITYTDEERRRLYEAMRSYEQAKRIFTEIWSRHIGEAVTFDIRTGEYK